MESLTPPWNDARFHRVGLWEARQEDPDSWDLPMNLSTASGPLFQVGFATWKLASTASGYPQAQIYWKQCTYLLVRIPLGFRFVDYVAPSCITQVTEYSPSFVNRWWIHIYSFQIPFHHEQPPINGSVLWTSVCDWSDCCLITIGNQGGELFRHSFGYRLREFQLFWWYQFTFCVTGTWVALEEDPDSWDLPMHLSTASGPPFQVGLATWKLASPASGYPQAQIYWKQCTYILVRIPLGFRFVDYVAPSCITQVTEYSPSFVNRWWIHIYSFQIPFHHEQPPIIGSVLWTSVCDWSDCCLITIGNQGGELFGHSFGYRLREIQLFWWYQFTFCVTGTWVALEQPVVSGVTHMQRVSCAQGCIVQKFSVYHHIFVGAVIGSILLSFGNWMVALSRDISFCCCIGMVAHITYICVRAVFISASCWDNSRSLASSFSIFSNSALWIDDLLDYVELEVDIIPSLSDSVARELSFVRSKKSESTLILSREGQSSSSKLYKFVDWSAIWGSILTFKGNLWFGCAALVIPPLKKKWGSNFFERFIPAPDGSLWVERTSRVLKYRLWVVVKISSNGHSVLKITPHVWR